MAQVDPFVIMFNGPPRSGKDSIAQALRKWIDDRSVMPTHMLHFATPMRDIAMGLIGESGFARYNEIKDRPQPLLRKAELLEDGPSFDTIRDFMIALSETFVKPRYGSDFWGRMLTTQYARGWWGKLPAIVLIPDLGFHPEMYHVISSTQPRRVLIVQTYREGTDWSKDSRGYVSHPGVHMLRLHNNGTIDDAVEKLVGMIGVIGFCSQVFPVR